MNILVDPVWNNSIKLMSDMKCFHRTALPCIVLWHAAIPWAAIFCSPTNIKCRNHEPLIAQWHVETIVNVALNEFDEFLVIHDERLIVCVWWFAPFERIFKFDYIGPYIAIGDNALSVLCILTHQRTSTFHRTRAFSWSFQFNARKDNRDEIVNRYNNKKSSAKRQKWLVIEKNTTKPINVFE